VAAAQRSLFAILFRYMWDGRQCYSWFLSSSFIPPPCFFTFLLLVCCGGNKRKELRYRNSGESVYGETRCQQERRSLLLGSRNAVGALHAHTLRLGARALRLLF